MGKWIHRITEKDVHNLMGVCSFCGPVRLLKKSKRFLCYNSQYKWKKQGKTLRSLNMTYEEYKTLSLACNYCCEICGEKSEKNLDTDHCHSSGHFRGLLCRSCNLGIGHLRDNIKILKKAIQYLEERSPAKEQQGFCFATT